MDLMSALEQIQELGAWLVEHGEPANVVVIPRGLRTRMLFGEAKDRARLMTRYRNVKRVRVQS